MATVLPVSGFAIVPTAGVQIPQAFPLQASGTITGGSIVAVSGSGTVAAAGATSAAVVGYSMDDGSSGNTVNVLTYGPVVNCVASGSITAGAKVVTAASGQVQTIGANTFEKIVGTALDTVSNGQTCRVVMHT